MAAYVISDVEIRDPALFERYRALAQDSIAKFGGRYVIRGGAIERVEGTWAPKAIVVVEILHHGDGARVVWLAGLRRGPEDSRGGLATTARLCRGRAVLSGIFQTLR